MVVAVKERILTGTVQSRQGRENAGSVSFSKAQQSNSFLFGSALNSRTAVYVTRTQGGGGGGREASPHPAMRIDAQTSKPFSPHQCCESGPCDMSTRDVH